MWPDERSPNDIKVPTRTEKLATLPAGWVSVMALSTSFHFPFFPSPSNCIRLPFAQPRGHRARSQGPAAGNVARLGAYTQVGGGKRVAISGHRSSHACNPFSSVSLSVPFLSRIRLPVRMPFPSCPVPSCPFVRVPAYPLSCQRCLPLLFLHVN